METKFVCIHGHFYQPPREDPWLEAIEFQESALPYHDWNERICAECYFPNAYARRLDGQGKIIEIVNNYEKISFNFGPTLLFWLKRHRPFLLNKIISADQKSCLAFKGHGNAISQVFNHIIMPLATTRDKVTQVRWGIATFKHFFGRYPEGMWLAETAVDNETLKILAQHKIKFTILAPRQAAAIRRIGESNWHEVDEGSLDISMPYRCILDDKHFIDIFFYHGGLSQGIAFGGLVQNGDMLAHHLEGTFKNHNEPQLISVATDGETFGHHWKFAEMALAYISHYFDHHEQIRLINFGAFLSRFNPIYEVKIRENTSWSCIHGIERWRDDCGCSTGAHPDWNQKWRRPLRKALNWLRDELTGFYEQEISAFLKDPWEARDDYIKIILSPSESTKTHFLAKHAKSLLGQKDRRKVFKLLEMQYYAQLMFTSCGWFFDDISGLEAQQNLKYASRAIQLVEDMGLQLEKDFLKQLKDAKSNLPQYGDGAQIYTQHIKPALYDLNRLAIHFSFSHLFDEPPSNSQFYSAQVEVLKRNTYEASGNRLIVDELKVTHLRTEEQIQVLTAVLYLGGLDVTGAIVNSQQEERLTQLFQSLSFLEAKDKLTKGRFYHINEIFFDNRQRLAKMLVEEKLAQLNNAYREFYQENKELMLSLKSLHLPLPETFMVIAKSVLEQYIYSEFQKELQGQPSKFYKVKSEINRFNLKINMERINKILETFVTDSLKQFLENWDIDIIRRINKAFSLCEGMCARVNLWPIQNTFWDLLPYLKSHYQEKLPSEIIRLAQILNFSLED